MQTKIHSQIKIHPKNINKVEKYKKLIMREHKTDVNITKYKKTEHDETQNRYEHY